MHVLIGLIFDALILGLIAHWVLGFIPTLQNDHVEKARAFLEKLYPPFIELVRTKIKPILKKQDGGEIDFSPLVLILILAVAKKLAFFVF